MLKLTLHAGGLASRSANNKLASIDIAYARRAAMADYLVALNQQGMGEKAPNVLKYYPRWSASLWDLAARAITRVLYDADEAPPAGTPDHRCAYATQLCAGIERVLANERGAELATVEIAQVGRKRGVYTASFDEDILGKRSADFSYGRKALDPVDLLLRAICWTLFGKDTLGPRPPLLLPATMKVDGKDLFDVSALAEPARTGFMRFMAEFRSAAQEPLPLCNAEDYVRFLMKA